MTWDSGASTELTLSLSGLGDGCLGSTDLTSDLAQPWVNYPLTLSATTSDGILKGSYPANLSLQPAANGAGDTKTLSFSQQYAATDVAQTGFSQLAIPDGTPHVGVALTAIFDGTSASGDIIVRGDTRSSQSQLCHQYPDAGHATRFGPLGQSVARHGLRIFLCQCAEARRERSALWAFPALFVETTTGIAIA